MRKVLVKPTEIPETRHKIIQTESSPPGIDQMKKKSKKRKKSGESWHQVPLDKSKFTDDYEADTFPAAKKAKGCISSELTRKQKRNRKKNSSKKNKYKHLALNKYTDEGNKASAGSCQVPVQKDPHSKHSAVTSLPKSVSQTDPLLQTEINCAENRTFSQQISQFTSTGTLLPVKEKVSLPANNNLLVSGKMPVNYPERKKRRQKHVKNQKGSECLKCESHLKSKTEALETYNNDDDDDIEEKTLDHINKNHCRPMSTDSYESTGTVTKLSQKSPKKMKAEQVFSAVDKARQRLNAARFRYLNEQLYTSTGAEALEMFQEDPEAFKVYHQGFQHQVSQWPVNPLDIIIKQLSKMSRSTVVADFGCGDARLAESLPHNAVHSFDLVSTKPCVTACDIAQVPLENSSVNVAVFCLALMGTNLSDYICEANRVLHKGGLLKIAEVVSRFYNISRFVKGVEAHGFQLQKKTFLDKMFMLFTFKKVRDSSQKAAPDIQLKACYYKRR